MSAPRRTVVPRRDPLQVSWTRREARPRPFIVYPPPPEERPIVWCWACQRYSADLDHRFACEVVA